MTRRQKHLAKEMRLYILVSSVIDQDIWLHDLWGISASYISYTTCEQLDDGYTTYCRLGMRFLTWCIVKLDYYVILCNTFLKIFVANDISHLEIKILFQIWLVGDVNITPEFLITYKFIPYFLPVKIFFLKINPVQ